MDLLVARTGLTLNPGQMADLVLAWRQLAGLIAAIPHSTALVDDQAFVFRLPAPAGGAAPPAARKPAATPKTAVKTKAAKSKAAKSKAAAKPKVAARKAAPKKAAAKPAPARKLAGRKPAKPARKG
jgi:hypothetical protein